MRMNLFGKTAGKLGRVLGLSAAACKKGLSPRILLQPQATLAIQPCRSEPQEVSCRRGTLWITQEGNGEDIILKPGQRVRLRSRGRVLIQALTASSFSMTSLQGMRTV